MECVWSKQPDGGLKCIHCGFAFKRQVSDDPSAWPHKDCHVQSRGPGHFLHDAILKWVGEGPTRECGCTDRINRMNAWGPKGCREHLDEIVEWLAEEAKRRGWWRYAVAVPGSRFFIKRMVLGAIKKAENR